MENFLQSFSRIGICKNNLGEFVAAQLAVGRNYFSTKDVLDFSQCRFSRLNELAGKFVGVHNLRAASAEKFSRSGFSHSNAAGQTADFHWQKFRAYGPVTAR